MKKKITASLITLMLCTGSAHAALDFSQTIFFGDSLTDSGAFAGHADAGNGSSFTTDPGNVWSENMAGFFGTSALANNPNNPNTDPNGTNYSQGGAQVSTPIGIGTSASPLSAQPISTQLATYLAATGGTADPDALYAVWGGANDLFYNMALVGGGLPLNNALTNLAGSAGQLAGLVQGLSDSGADLIIVPNLPDIGATPSSVLSTINTAGAGNPNLNSALTAAVIALAQLGTGQEMAALAAAEQVLGLPAGALTPAYQQMAALGTGLAQGYNAALALALAQTDANIVALDTYGLLSEVMANPTEFLLGNTTGVACVTTSALPCTSDTLIDPITPAVFLFADSVHPTTAGHRIFAEYAYSVVNAPALIATLAEVPHGMLRRGQQMIGAQIHSLPASGDWSLFGDYALGDQEIDGAQLGRADSRDNHLLVGAGRRIDGQFAVGAAIEAASSNTDFARQQGGFDLETTQLSLFAGYDGETLSADLTATLGLQADYDVRRIIAFNGSNRVQTGSTSGDLFALNLKIGATLIDTERGSFGPFVALSHQSVDVDGYRETGGCTAATGDCATAMQFGDQSRDSALAEAGIFADIDFAASQLHAELAYAKELDDGTRSISAGVLNTGSQFTLSGIEQQQDSWRLGLAYQAQLSPNASAHAGYQLRSGDRIDDQTFNIGVRIDF